jgi:hypothetical protein
VRKLFGGGEEGAKTIPRLGRARPDVVEAIVRKIAAIKNDSPSSKFTVSKINIMKKTALLIAALAFMSGMLAPVANAISLDINVGDRPYYGHGPGYWNGGVYYVWAPGHWEWRHHHRYWVHGHYRVR